MKFLSQFLFTVDGRPIPWSVPDIGVAGKKGGARGKGHRYVKKNVALEEWQQQVKRAARSAFGPFEAHDGPIHLDLTFVFETDDEGLIGKILIPSLRWEENQARWAKLGGLPDRTNLIKAVEDGCEGTFMINDTQVRSGSDRCVYGRSWGVIVSVGFLDPEDPFGE